MNEFKANILVVDDNPANLRVLSQILEREQYDVRPVMDGSLVISGARMQPPDLILLDISMPVMDGFEVCQRLKADEKTRDIPIIFISAIDEVQEKVRAFSLGGVDYITKPFNMDEVVARVRTHITLRRFQENLEKLVDERTRELRESQEKLRLLALYDALTGLPNRYALEDMLTSIFKETEPVSLVLLDIDDFTRINETLGHSVGDALLKQVAIKVSHFTSPEAILFRVGNDDFALVLKGADCELAAEKVWQVLRDLNEPLQLEGHTLYLTSRVGISVFPKDGQNIESILKNAESALAIAKQETFQSVCCFESVMRDQALERLNVVNQMRQALEARQFVIYYQHQIDFQNKKVFGLEALVRWKHAERGLLSPNLFIPVAEQSGLIHELGNLVIEEVCRQAREWDDAGFTPMPIAVNFSAIQLSHGNVEELIRQALLRYQIPPERLVVEITESAFLQNLEESAQRLEHLRKQGIKIHVDDFGTGYSSMAYLGGLPVDCIKIDRYFVDGLLSNAQDETGTLKAGINYRTIIKAILTLAIGLHKDVIAEGVETLEQMRTLHALGCDNMQGFLFTEPVPANAVPSKTESIINFLMEMGNEQE